MLDKEVLAENIRLRSAISNDAVRVQELRKLGWRDNYLNPETGVTKEVLEKELAVLPPPESDIQYFINTLNKPENKDLCVVAENSDGRVVGVIFCDVRSNGIGDIGVFVDKQYRGKGIGTKLLKELIERTDRELEVVIFAKNPSRNLYKKSGFIEVGEESEHKFREGVSLPTQKLVLPVR